MLFFRRNLDRGASSRSAISDGPRLQRNDCSIMACTFFGLYFGYYGLSTWIAVLVDSAGIGDAYTVAIYYALGYPAGQRHRISAHR